MDFISSKQQQYPAQSREPQGVVLSQDNKKKGLLEILLIFIIIVLLIGILNYLNILPLSKIFPNYLGFLPHMAYEQPKQYKNVTTAPTIIPTISLLEPAKQTFISYLPTILDRSIIPASSSSITFIEDKTSPQSFIASWKTKEKNIDSSFRMSQDLKKIVAIDFYVKSSELLSSISRETAESKATQTFSINPKGIWGCKKVIVESMLYCENFWEQSENSKRGLGALIITSPAGNRVVYYLCEHTLESDLYSWKSCSFQFMQEGVK